MNIYYGIHPFFDQSWLVGCTLRGLCALFLLSDADMSDQNIYKEFQTNFPGSIIHRHDKALEPLSEMLQTHFITKNGHFRDFPFDIPCTPFQEKVWRGLMEIPFGETISYGKLAQKLGMPSGARALAQACRSNLCSVVIPCHRVIRGDGTLSGYRWGTAWKQKLLNFEEGMRHASNTRTRPSLATEGMGENL